MELLQSNRDKKEADLPAKYFGYEVLKQGLN